jgi:hypothetical protein
VTTKESAHLTKGETRKTEKKGRDHFHHLPYTKITQPSMNHYYGKTFKIWSQKTPA